MNESFLQKILFFTLLFLIIFFGNQSYNSKFYTQRDNALNSQIKKPEKIPVISLPLKEDGLSNNFNLNSKTLSFEEKKEIIAFNDIYKNSSLISFGSQISNFKYKNFNFIEPDITAQIALVADLKTEKVIWGKNENKNWPLASLTKLITSVYTAKNFNLKENIEINENYLNKLNSIETSSVYFSAGDIYSVYDLIKLMLLPSNNAAAYALANYKNYDTFIAGMNALVKEWGVNSTFFSDPSGLYVSNQSNALDVLKIVKKIYEDHFDILRITQSKSLSVKELNKSKIKTIYNIHPFSGERNFLGGKTGETNAARQNLISVFLIKQRPILILVMGSENRAEDTSKILNWFNQNFELVEK
jgi:D-alanyl-D-alanine carboxypeptidase